MSISSVSSAPVTPTWIRIPKHGTRCPYTGLSRSYIFGLVASGKVRSKVIISDKASVRGVRLIALQSLLDFIESVPDAETPPVGDSEE